MVIQTLKEYAPISLCKYKSSIKVNAFFKNVCFIPPKFRKKMFTLTGLLNKRKIIARPFLLN
jgi:hypothetical protein